MDLLRGSGKPICSRSTPQASACASAVCMGQSEQARDRFRLIWASKQGAWRRAAGRRTRDEPRVVQGGRTRVRQDVRVALLQVAAGERPCMYAQGWPDPCVCGEPKPPHVLSNSPSIPQCMCVPYNAAKNMDVANPMTARWAWHCNTREALSMGGEGESTVGRGRGALTLQQQPRRCHHPAASLTVVQRTAGVVVVQEGDRPGGPQPNDTCRVVHGGAGALGAGGVRGVCACATPPCLDHRRHREHSTDPGGQEHQGSGAEGLGSSRGQEAWRQSPTRALTFP